MRTLNLYILRLTMTPFVGTVLLVLLVLLLERMLWLIELTVNSQTSFLVISQLLVTLVPHYLGMALPAAFFVAILLAFAKLSHNTEMEALGACGIGLHRLLLPIMAFAVLLTFLTGLLFGVLQPNSRYAYRALIFIASHASMSAAFEEGAFVKVGDLTFMAERVSGGGREISGIFVHQDLEDGGAVETTARYGMLIERQDELQSILYLRDGVRVTIGADGEVVNTLTFDDYRWPLGMSAEELVFRARGRDERELTLAELWAVRSGTTALPWSDEMSAEFHGRLVRIATILLLPLLAMPMGLANRRARRSWGVALGLVFLVIYQQVLVFGETLSDLGHVPAWLGLWLPFVLFGWISLWLFWRASFGLGPDPLAMILEGLERLTERIRKIRPTGARGAT